MSTPPLECNSIPFEGYIYQRCTLEIINGTSVISIYIPPKNRLEEITTMLMDEHGKAANVKDKTNRLSI
jgi:hypothetical protein